MILLNMKISKQVFAVTVMMNCFDVRTKLTLDILYNVSGTSTLDFAFEVECKELAYL